MGEIDLPTIIDHITEVTGQQKISYVGHSEGTTQMFLGASLKPDYFAEKINLFLALAPVASTANIPSPEIREAAKFIKEIELALVHEGKYYNWFAPMPTLMEGFEFACDMPLLKSVCKKMAGIMNHDGVDDPKAAMTFLSNEPAGASYRTFVYYAQMINSGRCALYDYGKIVN